MMNIIIRNLINVVGNGALNNDYPCEPMSLYKWRALFHIVERQNLSDFFYKGLCKISDRRIEIPSYIIKKTGENTTLDNTAFDFSRASLYFPPSDKRLKNIVDDECEQENPSYDTLKMLSILVFNENNILNNRSILRGVLQMGAFFKENYQTINFDKLDSWLEAIHLKQIAKLQGCILTQFFGLDKEIMPFITGKEVDTTALVVHSLSKDQQDERHKWLFKQYRSGLVTSNNKQLLKEINYSLGNLKYSPLESVSCLVYNIVTAMSSIDE